MAGRGLGSAFATAMYVSGMNPYAAAFNPCLAAEEEDVAEPLSSVFDDCPPPGLSARSAIAANMSSYACEFDPRLSEPEQDLSDPSLTMLEDNLASGLRAWLSTEGVVDITTYANELWLLTQGVQGSPAISPQLRDLHISSAGFEVTSKTTEDFMACSPDMPMKLSEPAWVKDLRAQRRFDDMDACVVSGSSGQAALELSRKLAQTTAFPAWNTRDAWLKWRAMHGAIACSEVSTGRGCTSENSFNSFERSAADEAEFERQEPEAAPAAGESSEDEDLRWNSTCHDSAHECA